MATKLNTRDKNRGCHQATFDEHQFLPRRLNLPSREALTKLFFTNFKKRSGLNGVDQDRCR